MQPALDKLSREDLIFEITTLREELAELKRLVFGKKSERFVPSCAEEQLLLDLAIETELPQVATQTIEVTRKVVVKKQENHPGRMPLPAHLERVDHVVEPEGVTPGMKKIGEQITESLEYTPGRFFVNRYIRPKYAKPQGQGVVIGVLPSRIIEKGVAGPSLLAHILIAKFTDHLPLHRQIEIYKREGMSLAASTMSDWVRDAITPLEPLYELIKSKVASCSYLQADETPIKVLDKAKKGQSHRGYYWLYHDVVARLVLFDYTEGRSAKGPQEILKNFQGYLQTDGYGVYDAFEKKGGIGLIHCMAHARRKFEQALSNKRELAEHALKEIQKLYEVERAVREAGLSYEQRREERQEKAAPVLEALGSWMQEAYRTLTPSSSIGEAVGYSLKRWAKLSEYAHNGMLEIDNNLVENAVRPVAIGRKNYLFAGSHEAAKRSAMMYTFTATCKKNEVNPYEWLKNVLTKISDHPINRIEELLPDNWKANQ